MTKAEEIALMSAATDGEWLQPRKRNFWLGCCDCALTHRLNFRLKNGRIQFQAFREKGITRTRRKQAGVTITKACAKD